MLGVPIDSVGRAGGTEHAPRALRERGIVRRVGARDDGDLDVRIRGDVRDPATGVIGIDGVLATTTALRAAVAQRVARGERVLVLGGCCTVLPGALAGVRDAAGMPGVAQVDGHVDVYTGHGSPTGEAADMPLGVAFGGDPQPWVQAAGGPAASPRHTVALGARDPEERADIGDLLAGPLAGLEVLDPAALRAEGFGAAGARAAARLAAAPGRFWIHLDVDVLDEREMPATDYLMPGGLRWDELGELMGRLSASPALAGLSLGCMNPQKDPDGEYVERTVALLERALYSASS
jgi:arginase